MGKSEAVRSAPVATKVLPSIWRVEKPTLIVSSFRSAPRTQRSLQSWEGRPIDRLALGGS